MYWNINYEDIPKETIEETEKGIQSIINNELKLQDQRKNHQTTLTKQEITELTLEERANEHVKKLLEKQSLV